MMVKMMRTAVSVIILVMLSVAVVPVGAQIEDGLMEEILEGRVVRIVTTKEVEVFEGSEKFQVLQIEIYKGSLVGEIVEIDQSLTYASNAIEYKTGDKVLVSYAAAPDGYEQLMVIDHVRRNELLILGAVFAGLVLVFCKTRGLRALLALGYSFGIIIYVMLPQIMAGREPVQAAIVSMVLIVPVSFYVTHGWKKKTHVAVAATMLTLIVAALLAQTVVEMTYLTGFASEEASFVEFVMGQVNIKGLLLAGILIGTLGVLDDITISQASVAESLAKTRNHKFKELYDKTLSVGNDHVASLVNTLMLVYAGASLPLLMLLTESGMEWETVINYEIIGEEVVRTLIGSIGLVLAVPITTFIAAKAFTRE